MAKKPIDFTGKRINKLTAIKLSYVNERGAAYWIFQCDCGKQITTRGSATFKSGYPASCPNCRTGNIKHGYAKTKTYTSWLAMKKRCLYPKHPQYHLYGGRGITIAHEWLEFSNFVRDMGERPAHTSLDRIDGTKGYSKDNCRWATIIEQAQNRRTTIVYKGKTITEWSKITGIPRRKLYLQFANNRDIDKLIFPKGDSNAKT